MRRLNSPDGVAAKLREALIVRESEAKSGLALLDVLLFPHAAQFERYLHELRVDPNDPITEWDELAPGCAMSNGARFAESGELRVLAMHVPDGTVSWADPQDRACLTAFFAESFGVVPEAMRGLLPPIQDRDCIFAKVVPNGAPYSAYSSVIHPVQSCPTAPIKRAASLVWYAKERGAGLGVERSTIIGERVLDACQLDRAQNRHLDESCPTVILGAQ